MANNIKKPETMEAFGELIKNATKDDKLIVIFFFVNWSAKCQYMLDIVERRLAGEHDDVDFIVVDGVDMVELRLEWRVDAFPMFKLLKRERIIYQILGPYPEELGWVIQKLKKRKVYSREVLQGPYYPALLDEENVNLYDFVLKRIWEYGLEEESD